MLSYTLTSKYKSVWSKIRKFLTNWSWKEITEKARDSQLNVFTNRWVKKKQKQRPDFNSISFKGHVTIFTRKYKVPKFSILINAPPKIIQLPRICFWLKMHYYGRNGVHYKKIWEVFHLFKVCLQGVLTLKFFDAIINPLHNVFIHCITW